MKTLPSKMKCYIIPKKDFLEKQALIVVGFGSADTSFFRGGTRVTHPDGTAHFLEHKLFANDHMNVTDEFNKLGASSNAFTNCTNTAYYFTCTENFYESLALLSEFVSEPHFTDENVESERGIIGQEIAMYRDSPFWTLQFNLLNALYEICPVKKNTLGDEQTIAQITKDTLYEAYHFFYRPENMALICAGDFDEDEVFSKAAELDAKFYKAPNESFDEISRDYGEEPPRARETYAETNMRLAHPMFSLGFKESGFGGSYAERLTSARIILDMVAGESSELFEKLLIGGKIDGPFALEYTAGNFFGQAVISNSCANPSEIAEILRDELANAAANGLDGRRFEQIRKKQIGRFMRGFNSIDGMVSGQADLHYKNTSFQDILDAYDSIRLDTIEARLKNLFREDNFALSVIKP